MRIIFVGVHNKPLMQPLDSRTKSGKLIDRVIAELPKSIEVLKTNLINLDFLPVTTDFQYYAEDWLNRIEPNNDDIIILLGNIVQYIFKFDFINIIRVAHPSSVFSRSAKENYVTITSNLIINRILHNVP